MAGLPLGEVRVTPVTLLQTTMDPAELEFLAEKHDIQIVPNFTHAVMHLIQARSALLVRLCLATIPSNELI